jgi:class 3 adenylate cyclase
MADDELDLEALLADLDTNVKTELDSKPTVEDWNEATFDVATLPIEARKWIKIPDVVVVVADLKNSTKLGTGKHDASTASIYQAATGNIVEVFDEFDADFIQIQGDGAFAIFWGDRRYERALCAGITVKTCSEVMVTRLEKKWPTLPETGFKVGIASHRVLVKRVGTPRNPAKQEPVWAGKPVNYAAKAAQQADRHELIVTGSVWDQVEKNDYLTVTCPCNGGPKATLWTDVTIDKIPDSDAERDGRVLTSKWCKVHGAEYAAAVLAGEKKRTDADTAKAALSKQLTSNGFRLVRQRKRIELSNLRRGLGKVR